MRTKIREKFSAGGGRRTGASWGALAACLVGTVLATWITASQERAREEVRFQGLAERYQNIIGERVNTYVQVLKGAAGLFAASESVQRDEWRAYFEHLNLSERYGGLKVLGCVEHVWKTNLPGFLTRMREEKSRYYEATADFQVRSTGSGPSYYVVKYVEPLQENQPALGYDIGSEPTRRQAADEACDTGEATLTRLIHLVQAPQSPGALLLLPVFFNATHPTNASQRRACLQGWVYAAFVMEDLMTGIHHLASPQVGVEIFDGTTISPDTLLYTDGQSQGRQAMPSRTSTSFSHSTTLIVGRRVWTLHFTATPAFAGAEGGLLPPFLLVGGSLVSLLVFGIARSLGVSEQRAVALANQMTGRVRLQERAMLSSNDGIFILDAQRENHPIIYTNPAFVEMTGYSLEDGLDQDTATLRNREAPAFDLLRLRTALKGGIQNRMVLHERRRDGTPLWAELHVSPVRDDHGKVTHFLGVIEDITERKEAADTLRRERILLRTVLDNLPDVIYAKDTQCRKTLANRAELRILGCPTEAEALGKTDHEFYSKEVASGFFADDQSVIRTGQPILERDERFVDAQGRSRRLLTSKLPLRDESGRIIGLVGIGRDITEWKLAEQALRESQERFALAVQGTNDGIWDWNVTTNEVYFSPHWKTMLGYEEHEVENTFASWECLLHPEDRERALATIQAYFSGASPTYELEHRLRHKDGSYRYILARGIAVRDEQDRPVRMVGSHVDLTERKQSEETLRTAYAELAQSRDDLRRSVEQLKASKEELEKTQLQLIQAARLESVGSLAAGVAHEVKNPLQTILMGVEYLANNLSSTNETVVMALGDMRDAVKRANGIIRELLQLSAVSDLEIEEADLNEVVERSLRLVNHELVAAQVDVVRQLQAPLPRVRMDRRKIEQVLINLFINALQAMSAKGTLSITTRSGYLGNDLVLTNGAERCFPSGERVVVAEIRDTGPGIAEPHLARIFDPFFTTKPVGLGTGLGLSVVKKIMDLHDGTVEIQNAAEGGAQVTLVLRAQDKETLWTRRNAS